MQRWTSRHSEETGGHWSAARHVLHRTNGDSAGDYSQTVPERRAAWRNELPGRSGVNEESRWGTGSNGHSLEPCTSWRESERESLNSKDFSLLNYLSERTFPFSTRFFSYPSE